jgi:kumamolisin
VEAFSRAAKLDVVEVDLPGRSVVLSGTVRALSEAFRVRLQMYQHGDAVYRERRGSVHVPSHLGAIVQGVFGLDTRPRARRA